MVLGRDDNGLPNQVQQLTQLHKFAVFISLSKRLPTDDRCQRDWQSPQSRAEQERLTLEIEIGMHVFGLGSETFHVRYGNSEFW